MVSMGNHFAKNIRTFAEVDYRRVPTLESLEMAHEHLFRWRTSNAIAEAVVRLTRA